MEVVCSKGIFHAAANLMDMLGMLRIYVGCATQIIDGSSVVDILSIHFQLSSPSGDYPVLYILIII